MIQLHILLYFSYFSSDKLLDPYLPKKAEIDANNEPITLLNIILYII